MATTLGPMADWRLYKIAHDAWHAEALRPRRLPFLASRGSNRPHHRRDMNVCFHVAHAAMKPVNAGLAYRSRDLALAVLEYLTNWPAACAQSPRRLRSWATKCRKFPCDASEANSPASALNKTGSVALPT